MLSEPDTLRPPAAWYLIACDGDLMLRLAQDLYVGEDEAGDIVLSPAREDSLLKVSTDGHELTLQATAMDLTFSETGGPPLQHMTFLPGTAVRVNFPNGALLLAPDFRAGQRIEPDRTVDLVETTPPAVALSRVSEPITLIEQQALTWQPDAGGAPTDELVAILDEPLSTGSDDGLLQCDHDIPDEAIPTLREPVSGPTPIRAPAQAGADPEASGDGERVRTEVEEIRAPATPPTGRNRNAVDAPAGATGETRQTPGIETESRRWPTLAVLGGILAAALLAAPMVLFMGERRPEGVAIDASAAAPEPGHPMIATPPVPETTEPAAMGEPQADQPAPIEQNGSVATPVSSDETPASPAEPQTATAGAPPTAEMATDTPPTTPALTDAQAARIGVLLDEAQVLYDADHIVTPVHDNAVSRLTEVLHMDPGNEAGLHLMYLSAERLVEEAQAAHAAGDDYLARNLLEDVLGFHPEFEPARKLRREWMDG
ncbi:MAG: hypothetical protein PVF57_05765 [Pseudomonadales bacterium]|jgi:hypothetical protein